MRGRTASVAMLLLFVLTVSACTYRPCDCRTDMGDRSDERIQKSAIEWLSQQNTEKVDLDVYRGVLYLNGPVSTVEEKERIEQLSWQIQGVKAVVNNLNVKNR